MKNLFALSGLLVFLLSAPSMAANPQVTLQISGAVTGSIVIELYPTITPVTVANFVNYVQAGFYNNTLMHRISKVSPFVIQGGGYDATTGYEKTTGQPILNESYMRLSNVRGTIAMAREPLPETARAQFFINTSNNTSLDYATDGGLIGSNAYYRVGYCVFGRVISGMNVVDAIAALETDDYEIPTVDVVIQSATLGSTVSTCLTKLPGDVDGDCRVDMADMALLAANWLACNSVNSVCR